MTVTVFASSKTGGKATITNHRTGVQVSHTFAGQPALCEYDAEWIVEDFSSGGLVPFANFGKVAFTNAKATTLAGKTVGHEKRFREFGKVIVDVHVLKAPSICRETLVEWNGKTFVVLPIRDTWRNHPFFLFGSGGFSWRGAKDGRRG